MSALVPGTPVRLVRGEKWWILDGGFFAGGGTKYSGPYETKEDAFTARRSLEAALKQKSFYIDAEVEPPTPAKPALLPEGWYLSRSMEVWWFNSMGYCNRANDTSGRLHQEEIQVYAPFTALGSLKDHAEVIAKWLESLGHSWAINTAAPAIRREFGEASE